MSEENTTIHNGGNNNNLLMGIIIVLLIVIAVLAFFVGKNVGQPNTGTQTPITGGELKDISVTFYQDARCSSCNEEILTQSLKELPVLANVEFIVKDFADDGVEDYLKENNINALPAVILNRGDIDPKLNEYINKIPSGEYTLNVGAKFDPFAERSERGFLVLDTEKLAEIKTGAYIEGNTEAQITWLEYSDLECPYCAKLHNSSTPDDLTEKYGDKLNVIFNHFPLGFHANAQPGAEILECLGETNGSDAFYSLMKTAFKEEKSTQSFLIDEAVKLGANKATLEACLDSEKYADKVQTQMANGTELFGVTGTPGNVLINNETGEYEVLSGAFPTESFETIIDKLLK